MQNILLLSSFWWALVFRIYKYQVTKKMNSHSKFLRVREFIWFLIDTNSLMYVLQLWGVNLDPL